VPITVLPTHDEQEGTCLSIVPQNCHALDARDNTTRKERTHAKPYITLRLSQTRQKLLSRPVVNVETHFPQSCEALLNINKRSAVVHPKCLSHI